MTSRRERAAAAAAADRAHDLRTALDRAARTDSIDEVCESAGVPSWRVRVQHNNSSRFPFRRHGFRRALLSLQVLALTTHAAAAVRVRALKEMCPCRVKGDIARFWDRVLDMTHDEDAGTVWLWQLQLHWHDRDLLSGLSLRSVFRVNGPSHVFVVVLLALQRCAGRFCTPYVTAPHPIWRTPSCTLSLLSTGTRTR